MKRGVISNNKNNICELPHKLTNDLTVSVPETLKNSIFEMPIISQTLNINNLRSADAKSVNLHTMRKNTDYSFQNMFCKSNVYSYGFRNVTV